MRLIWVADIHVGSIIQNLSVHTFLARLSKREHCLGYIAGTVVKIATVYGLLKCVFSGITRVDSDYRHSQC